MMTVVILIFAALTLLAGIVIVINPEIIFGILRNNFDKLALHILAVVVRLVLGFLLIYQSKVSSFPFAIAFIGWFSIVAGIFLAVIGRNNFTRLMSWALSAVKNYARIGGVLVAALGVFLIYAFI